MTEAVKKNTNKKVEEETGKKETSGNDYMKHLPEIGDKLKYGFHNLLVITERIIVRLMEGYKKTVFVDGRVNLDFNKDQGFTCFDKGKYEKAIQFFSKYLEEGKEDDAEILFCMGSSYVNIGDDKEALVYFEKAAKLDEEDSEAAFEVANCQMKLEKHEEAVKGFEKLTESDRENDTVYYSLGISYEKIGREKEAIDVYKKAIELQPRNSLYYHSLGFAYESSGKHADAIACFKKAMELEKKR